MSIIDKFSERFRAVRENRSWSQARMADYLGVATGTIGNWETGSAPSLAELERVAEKLQENPAYLLGFSDSVITPQKGLALREEASGAPWRHLGEETLRLAMADLSRAGQDDEVFAHLEAVVGELRARARTQRGSKPTGGGATGAKSPKVAAAVSDLGNVSPKSTS